MQHPEEGIIHAWIDGELSQEEASALETHVAECSDCAERVAEARGLVAASSRIVSALDIIPGDVIPIQQKKHRAWYSSTQFRAAAAVAFVAGASMLLMNNNKQASVDGIMTVSTPAEAPAAPAPEAAAATSMATPAAADLSTNQKEARKLALKAKTEPASPPPLPPVAVGSAASDELNAAKSVRQERDLSRAKAGTSASAPAPAPAPALSNIVVTGAAAEASPELRKVRADSTTASVMTVFQIDSGAQVTLTDLPPKGFMADAQKVRRSMAAPQAQRSDAQANIAAAAPPSQVVNSITWIDKRGHTMTLSGPVSKERLEEVRLRLPVDQR